MTKLIGICRGAAIDAMNVGWVFDRLVHSACDLDCLIKQPVLVLALNII
jgi:hypothetical protein